MGEGKFYSGELGALEVSSSAGQEPQTTDIIVTGADENDRVMIMFQASDVAVGDTIYEDEDNADFVDGDGNYLPLSDAGDWAEDIALPGAPITAFALQEGDQVTKTVTTTIWHEGDNPDTDEVEDGYEEEVEEEVTYTEWLVVNKGTATAVINEELVDIELSSAAGSEAGKTAITVSNYDDVFAGVVAPLYSVNTTLENIPSTIYHDTDQGLWLDADNNDLDLADFDIDDFETNTGEVDASDGDTFVLIGVIPFNEEEGNDFHVYAGGDVAAVVNPGGGGTLADYVAALNEDAQAQAIGTYAVSGDDIAVTPSEQFNQILAALEGGQGSAVAQYWAQFKAALVQISSSAAQSVDPDPSVNVIYDGSTVFSAKAGQITYNKYN